MGPRNVVRLFVLASAFAFPLALAAQEEGGGRGAPGGVTAANPGRPQTDAQKRGEAIFAKNCHLCHIFSTQKVELKILSTQLVGLFKDPATTEDGVRQVIQQGIPRKMPSFKYNFQPSEMDDLIAYMKIR